MDAGRVLRRARRRAHLTQRALAFQTGIAQPTVARIEVGSEVPRVDTLARLLGACDETIEALPRSGVGIDRTGIRAVLALTPRERVEALRDEAATLARVIGARRLR
jgi:transcriptional regulator with XRE-family HTH domain